MGGGCESPDNGMPTGCCNISTDISVGLPDVTVADTHQFKQLLTLDAPQPPPALPISIDLSIPSSDHSQTFVIYELSRSDHSPGTYTYLLTSRLRI